MRGLAAALLFALALPAQGACRLALALGLDVSGSVDAAEYRLQLDGLAAALLRPDVTRGFLAFPGAPVRLYVFEWAGRGDRRPVIGWQEVTGAGDLARIATALRRVGRSPTEPTTAIGAALRAGAAALAQQPDCARHVLDLSGDGKSNTGPRPRDTATPGITVNGLVIVTPEVADLRAYYASEVIRGPDAFTEVATGFHDYEAAMARKLLRELTHLILSGDP